jgi:hypothetical protein
MLSTALACACSTDLAIVARQPPCCTHPRLGSVHHVNVQSAHAARRDRSAAAAARRAVAPALLTSLIIAAAAAASYGACHLRQGTSCARS